VHRFMYSSIVNVSACYFVIQAGVVNLHQENQRHIV
jgi:hypothetical protein